MGNSKHQLVTKSSSEPNMPSVGDYRASLRSVSRDSEYSAQSKFGSHPPQASVRRCLTHTEFQTVDDEVPLQYPNLLHLFNIFQCNRPVQPPARMVVTVSLVGTLQKVRLLVAYDATVLDLIKASLKAFVKEGRLLRNDRDIQAYGLHYSQFCLESIDPAVAVNSLRTRNFCLHPTSTLQQRQPPDVSQNSKPMLPSWWNSWQFIFAQAANFFFFLCSSKME